MLLSSRVSSLPNSKWHRGCFLYRKHHLLYRRGRAGEFTTKPGGKPFPTCWIIRIEYIFITPQWGNFRYWIIKGAITRTPTQAGLCQSAGASEPHQDVPQASKTSQPPQTPSSPKANACGSVQAGDVKMRSTGRWDSTTARVCENMLSQTCTQDNGKQADAADVFHLIHVNSRHLLSLFPHTCFWVKEKMENICTGVPKHVTGAYQNIATWSGQRSSNPKPCLIQSDLADTLSSTLEDWSWWCVTGACGWLFTHRCWVLAQIQSHKFLSHRFRFYTYATIQSWCHTYCHAYKRFHFPFS